MSDDILFPAPGKMSEAEIERSLEELAARYRSANGLGMQLLNLLGGKAEGLIDKLPGPVREGLDGATRRALGVALEAAERSRTVIGDQPGWLNTTVTSAMGAAGGFGGLPTALAELPVTTTILLRMIQAEAAREGFNPASESVRFDCIEVFGAAGPLEQDDGANTAFLTTRLTLNGASLQKIIATVAPRLATVLGQKLAAQTIPVLGAVAGAATNYAYTSYYSDMAAVHFRLRRLAIVADRPHGELAQALRLRLQTPPISRAS